MRITQLCTILLVVLTFQNPSAGSSICEAPRLEDMLKELNDRAPLHREELITIPYRPDAEGVNRQHELPIDITPSFVY